MLEWFTGPTRAAGRFSLKLAGKGGAFVLRRLARFLGSAFLEDIAQFLTEFEGVIGGFRDRARDVFALLRSPRVAFVLIASPAPLAIDEAIAFQERLARSEMRPRAFIVNRVHPAGAPRTADELDDAFAHRPELRDFSREERHAASAVLAENDRDLAGLAGADALEVERLRRACGGVTPILEVPFLSSDVHDTEGILQIERSLFPG
jgi:hypothetical protein